MEDMRMPSIHYNKSIEIKPTYSQALFDKGLSLAKLEKFEQAIDAYEQAVAINPNYVNAHYNLGLALLQLKQI